MLGMDEQTVAQYKAWALASTFQSLATVDETTSSNAMAIDLYVNAKAGNAGIPIDAVETYAFQGGIFDSLSPEYQEAYLAGGLLMVLDVDTMGPGDPRRPGSRAGGGCPGARHPGGHSGPVGPDQRHDGHLEGPGPGGV